MRPVTSINVKLTTITMTQDFNVIFLDAEKAALGPVACRAPRNAKLVTAVLDDSGSFVFAISLETKEMFVFRVLMTGTNVPSECTYVYKFGIEDKLASLSSSSAPDDVSLNGATGTVIVSARNETHSGEMISIKTSQFVQQRNNKDAIYSPPPT